MKKSTGLLLAILAAAALPAEAEWELLRGNESQRLLIEPKSMKVRGAVTSFKYLVDFREAQGEVGGKYRSLVVGAALRCKERTIAMRTFQLFDAAAGEGVLIAMPAPKAAEQRFQRVLWNDPAIGVVRHADAGYPQAQEVTKRMGLDVPL